MKINIKSRLFRVAAVTALVLAFPTTGSCATKMLMGLPSGDRVSRVNISEAMIKLGAASMLPGPALASYAGFLLEEPKNIEIYSCENPTIFDGVRDKFGEMLSNYKWEEMLTAVDGADENNILMLYDKAQLNPEAVVIFNSDKSSINIIAIQGRFNTQLLTPDTDEP